MKSIARKSVLIFFIDTAVILGLLLAIPLMAQAQDGTEAVLKKKFTIQWQIDNREEDVQEYQVYLVQGLVGETLPEPTPYGDKIMVTGTEWLDKLTMSLEVLIDVPAGKDSQVWATVVAIDTSQNISHFAKPWVGYRFMNQAPAEPQGLTGGQVTDATEQ